MKDNETYKYLNKYKYILIDINALKDKIDKLSLLIYNISTASIIGYEKDRNIKDVNPDSLLNSKVAKILDLKNEYADKVVESEKLCKEIRSFIKSNASDELGRTILERYFCDNWNMEKISVESHYSFQYIRRKFYRDIKEIELKRRENIKKIYQKSK